MWQIVFSTIIVIVILVCSLSIFFYGVSYISDIFSNDVIVIFGQLFYFSILLFLIWQTIFNAKIYIDGFNKEEKLEINNNQNYMLYSVKINEQIQEIKANFDDIYLIKCYKATFINLYYYEVFYTEDDVIKKIIVSISLVPNLEKKIKKKIKLIKEEDTFCPKLPKPKSWI